MRLQFFACAEQFLFFARFGIGNVDRVGKNLADQRIAEFARIFNFNLFRVVKHADDFFAGAESERAQKDGSQNAFFAVDFCVNKFFLLIYFEFKPASAVRNNAARVYAFFVIKNNAGRTVYLRYDNAFGSVYDKGSAIGHQRNVAHVNGFLPDFARLLKNQIDAGF